MPKAYNLQKYQKKQKYGEKQKLAMKIKKNFFFFLNYQNLEGGKKIFKQKFRFTQGFHLKEKDKNDS